MAFKLKHLLNLQYGTALKDVDRCSTGNVPVFGSNGLIGQHDQPNTQDPAIIVGRKGSFGKITWTKSPAFCIDTAFYVDQRYCSGDLRFAYYLLQTLGLDEVSQDAAVPGLSRQEAHDKIIPYVDAPQQRSIANFLDRETSRIDALIAEKEKMIGLLQEKRSALITQAVTKGLDPNVPMKDSGVEWIGEVPAHWCVSRLKRGLKLYSGRDYKDVEAVGSDSGYPVYGSGGPFSSAKSFLYDGESVLFGRKGTIGKPVYVSGKFWAVDTVLYSKISHHFYPKFVYYLAHVIPYHLIQTDTALPSMTQSDLLETPIAYPHVEEQTRIARFLDRTTSTIGKVKMEIERSISLLEEKRQSLITAAVTGQLDISEMEAAA